MKRLWYDFNQSKQASENRHVQACKPTGTINRECSGQWNTANQSSWRTVFARATRCTHIIDSVWMVGVTWLTQHHAYTMHLELKLWVQTHKTAPTKRSQISQYRLRRWRTWYELTSWCNRYQPVAFWLAVLSFQVTKLVYSQKSCSCYNELS